MYANFRRDRQQPRTKISSCCGIKSGTGTSLLKRHYTGDQKSAADVATGRDGIPHFQVWPLSCWPPRIAMEGTYATSNGLLDVELSFSVRNSTGLKQRVTVVFELL